MRVRGRLTSDKAVSDGGTITNTIIVGVATRAIESFSDGDQTADWCGRAGGMEILPVWTIESMIEASRLQAQLSLHDRGSRLEY